MTVLAPPRADMKTELARIRQVIDAELTSRSAFVGTLTDYLKTYQGKMLRPTLLLLSAQSAGEIHQAHYVLGAVVELVHIATLVHDDVLDESRLRRGQPALHTRYGNEAAVLLGDYLFSHAFHLCCSLDDQRASRMISAAAHRLCEGELMQVAARGRWDLTPEEYFEIISGKTAQLVALSCRLGALYAEAAPETADRLADYGLHCGLAFQIVDDVLDLVGSERALGKNVGRDIGMGKLTLPLILYLGRADAAGRERMIGLLESGTPAVEQIRQILQASAAIEQALKIAQHHVRTAIESLSELPAGTAAEALAEAAEFILQRQS